jgi:hypothetical protein
MQRKIVKDLTRHKDGKYTLDMTIDGQPVKGLPEHVPYRVIREAAKEIACLLLPPITAYTFVAYGGEKVAHLEGRT